MHHLMGTTEIANMLGVSRQRAGQLVRTAGFPEPTARLAAGPVWDTSEVERWARETGRQSAGSPQDNHQGPSTSTD